MRYTVRTKLRQLLAATLLVSGTLSIVGTAIADTPAGTAISNTANATYEDNDGQTFNATSNEVKVTVAEVAGVFVTPLSTIDRNGGNVLPNDIIDYEFKVTNTGNDTTEFFIPPTPTLSGPGSATQVLVAGYIDAQGNRVNFPTPILVPSGATKTSEITGLPGIPNPSGGTYPAGVVPADYALIVQVPVTVNALASSGSDLTVQLGNTANNDNTPGTQNQLDSPDGATANEVRTIDHAGETGTTAAILPATEQREASATTTIKIGSQAQALATILKTRSAAAPNSPTTLSDDVLTYGLSLEIESTAPAGSTGITPGKLVGIEVLGIGQNRVLVSDAVPVNTDLTTAADVKAPNANWIPVYTTDPLATPAIKATWSTSFTATATRIGFVYDTGANGALNEGAIVTGFEFKVVTNGVTGSTPVNIANIAQVFGQTQGNTGPTAPLVYDESGDQMPSNFNENGTPGNPPTLTPSSTTLPTGTPDPANQGVDSGNNNSGTGPGGEVNVYTVALPGTILNGPSSIPGAVGPNDNNDDFSNESTPIPANTPPNTLIDPDPVTFQNSLSNPDPTNPLTNILLVPDTVNFTPGAKEELPPLGTKITLTYGGMTAVYELKPPTGGATTPNFEFVSGQAIQIPTLAAGETVNYTMQVDLPANTPLSTDTGKGFAVPVYAFKDVDGDSRPDAPTAEPTQNRTIDRVYTGFLKMTKEARIIDADGNTVIQPYTTDNTLLTGKGAPGRYIEYRIRYENISIAPVGSGNATLDAKNITVTEDGAAGTNSWAKDQNSDSMIDTSHTTGSVTSTFGATTFYPSGEQSGTTATTDVTKYIHQPGVIIQPQATGEFTFRRKIN